MRLVLCAGTTRTAAVDGISAAGADPEAMRWTPSADAELLAYGDVVRAPTVPESPTGCPTPALVTRAVRDLVGFDVTVVDAGLAEPSGAPTVTVGARPGDDIREPDPVPTAPGAFEAARAFGRALPDDEVVLAETVPGGTTTALAVMRALGEDAPVSSSLPDNPLARKEQVVEAAFAASDAAPGDFAGDPRGALRSLGDPVLAVVAGLAVGCLATDTHVTLGGGTQMLAAASVVRHAGRTDPLSLATTSFIADDVPIREAAAERDLDFASTDPGFDRSDHRAMRRYVAGEAKEGAGMGGALALARRAEVPMADVRERVADLADDLLSDRGDDAADSGSDRNASTGGESGGP